jgi:thioredoxin 1
MRLSGSDRAKLKEICPPAEYFATISGIERRAPRFFPVASRRSSPCNRPHPTPFPRFPRSRTALRAIRRPIPAQLESYPMSEQIVHITDDSFDAEVLKADKPVLVDYWAEWCGPCRMIAPILDEIAGEYADRVKVCKLNVDENQNTPPKYGIRGIPTLMLFRNGNVEATKVGALSKSQLVAFLDSSLR